MRFMMLMIPRGYENAAPGTMPDAKAVAAMMKYNEELQQAGGREQAHQQPIFNQIFNQISPLRISSGHE